MLRLVFKLLLLAALCVGIAELTVRTVLRGKFEGTADLEDFYSAARDSASVGSVDLVFVGTSRVAGSVAPRVVSAVLDTSGGARRSVRGVNVGKGYSTLILHYYGLRRLYREHPDHMRGAILMIEAPSGLPLYREWDDEWVLDGWPTLIGPVLERDNVGPFVWKSSNTLFEKAYGLAAGPLRSIRFARYVQPKLKELVNERLGPDTDEAVGPVADLSTAGGIRADSAGVALVRERVLEESKGESDPTMWRDWERSVTADLVRLARAHGGDVVFFEMPESSYQHGKYTVDQRRRGEQAFAQWAEADDIVLLRLPAFETTDNDFPDLLHMRRARRQEYSTRLAYQLLKAGYPD
jgi:hypothetical protein